jgi:lysyl-tRNA synthetase class 1
MFWADQIVKEVIEKRKPPFKVYDWWTPSGMAHAGHIRTFLLHQAIYRGLQLHGHEATYHYGWDDMDPMDGLPPDVPEDYGRYLGVPLCNVPSHVPGFESLADYYASNYLEAMEVLDIHPEVPRTSEMYRAGEFNEAITTVLENASMIRAIYADLGAERPPDWLPFQPICAKCGKIGTTYAYLWDGKEVSYRCEPKLVTWAQGCGYEGKVSPYNGTGKMHWKVEWPSTWFILGTDYEGGGKDHYTKNSSRDYGRRIIKDVFQSEEPIGYGHEFFTIGGKKMASSKGLGATASEAVHFLPPHIMRYFVYRIPPSRHLEFTPEGDTIPRIFDEYDRGLEAIQNDPDSNEARALIYSHQSQNPLPIYAMRFSKVSFLVQMPHINIIEVAEKEKGSPLSESERQELDIRIEYARRWLQSYAESDAKFELQPKLPTITLSQEQKIYLARLAEGLKSCAWEGEVIHTLLHDVKNEMSIPPKTAFAAIYSIFLNKDHGPQAGWFLAALDKTYVLHRLEEATKEMGG